MSTQEINLKAIADAIREKEGSTEPIPASEFPARILALETGGVPEGTYMIALESSDPEGGAVSGGGLASKGVTVTVRAETADGYKFAGWQQNGQIVSKDVEYTFAVIGDRMLTAVFEVHISRLPKGYTEVEYIQSSGTQFINTGIKPGTSLKISMDIKPLIAASTEQKYFFDSFYFPTNGYKYVFRMVWSDSGVQAAMGAYSSVAYTTVNSSNAMRRMDLQIDASGKTASADGKTITFSNNTFHTSMNTIRLLTYNTDTSTYALPANLYSCQIDFAGVPSRDFVPCIGPTGAVGLYDLVEGKFYGNAGTGAFTAGPAV